MSEIVNQPIYEPVDSVVNLALIACGETNAESRYQEFLQYAVLGLDDLNFSGAAKESKTVVLELSSYRTADLPNDYVDWVAVALKRGEVLEPLTYNHRLSAYFAKDDCGDPIANMGCTGDDNNDLLASGFYFSGYYGYGTFYRNGQYLGKVFGAGGGDIGPSFKEDKNSRRLIFSHEIDQVNTEVILEYVPKSFNPDGSTGVHAYCRMALRDFIVWQAHENDRAFTLPEKQRKYDLFRRSKKKAMKWMNSWSPKDFVNTTRKHNSQAPKF